MKFYPGKIPRFLILATLALSGFAGGCNIVKKESKTAILLATRNATQAELVNEINRFARVDSMRAKMDLKFEDNSFAEFGTKEVYREAEGEIVVQRPGKILLKVKVPVIKTDVAQMTSDGQGFRVAILQDGGSGKYKKFVKGSNKADYSPLQKTLSSEAGGNTNGGKGAKENVNAFANMRPQHFTDAVIVRPVTDANVYTQSTIYQVEEDISVATKSPTRNVTRGYYLLDEFEKAPEGGLKITRRFWFDRVGIVRLARQQIFDVQGEIESDIVYGKEGNLTETGDFLNLPLQIQVTRPKERYSMRLTYSDPGAVTIGTKFQDSAFVLQNSWNLEEVDLDQKLREAIIAPSSQLDRRAVSQKQ